jgi:hypothetical protein
MTVTPIASSKTSRFAMDSEFSTEKTSQKKQILDKIYPIEEQVVSLKNAIKKESKFNAKVRLITTPTNTTNL